MKQYFLPVHDCITVPCNGMDAEALMYRWWWSNFSQATSCEHASHGGVGERRVIYWGCKQSDYSVTDERANATLPEDCTCVQ